MPKICVSTISRVKYSKRLYTLTINNMTEETKLSAYPKWVEKADEDKSIEELSEEISERIHRMSEVDNDMRLNEDERYSIIDELLIKNRAQSKVLQDKSYKSIGAKRLIRD